MAMVSGRPYGGGVHSHTVTETYTLEEAINKASTGGLSPSDVYRQMPEQIQEDVDRLARRRYSRLFNLLDIPEKRRIMADLATDIKQMKEAAETPVSVLDALRLAADGKIDDIKLYDALPKELHAPIDALSRELCSSEFKRAKPEVRSQVFKVLLAALTEQGTSDAAEAGLDLHNRALELKKKGNSAEALKAMRDSVKALSNYVTSNQSSARAEVGVYCNLSSAQAHIGDWSGEASSLQSAIKVADRGLALDDGSTGRASFNRAVLLHNRGHAGWRLGELTLSRATLKRAIEDVAAAQKLFVAAGNPEAIKENSNLNERAQAALAKLPPQQAPHSGSRIAVAPARTAPKISSTRSSAEADARSRRNIEYRDALRKWKALRWWKRVRTKKPDLPPGVVA